MLLIIQVLYKSRAYVEIGVKGNVAQYMYKQTAMITRTMHIARGIE